MANPMNVRLDGVEDLNRDLARVIDAVEQGGDAATSATVDAVAEEWRSNVPVASGEYQASIDSDDDMAFATAEHAIYVEFGTSRMPANPVGAQAAEAVASRMADTVAGEIDGRFPT